MHPPLNHQDIVAYVPGYPNFFHLEYFFANP